MTDYIKQLEEIFTRLPGIGPKQAQRIAHALMNKPDSFTKNLSFLIEQAKHSSRVCEKCFMLFAKEINSSPICEICQQRSKSTTLFVVTKSTDIEHIEKMSVYRGLYFVLGSSVPIVKSKTFITPRIPELKSYLEQTENIKEILLGFNANTEGEHTTVVVEHEIKEICNKKEIKISVLGKGFSTGTEIEYVDAETMKSALENKKIL